MSDEWLTNRVRAGDRIAERILGENGNPVHPGVELGRAAGLAAVKFYELHGESASLAFLQTLISVCNLETAKLNLPSEVLRMEMSHH